MADSMTYIALLAALIAGGQFLRSLLRAFDHYFLIKTSRDWLQRQLPSRTSQSFPSGSESAKQLANILPPSRRSSLPDHLAASERHESANTVLERQIDMDQDCSSYEPTHCTPTGITIEEINSLGKFPDYASFSGVPLPQPCPEFDIDTALPRPYRPFRWQYHQTMGMCTPRT